MGLLSVAEILCFSLGGLICCRYGSLHFHIILLLLWLDIVLLLSGLTLSSRVQSGWMRYLGKLSVPAFIFHWVAGTAIDGFFPDLAGKWKFLLYYMLTMIFSAFMLEAVSLLQKRWQKHSPPA